MDGATVILDGKEFWISQERSESGIACTPITIDNARLILRDEPGKDGNKENEDRKVLEWMKRWEFSLLL
jgi:hypothetical protein